MHTKHIKTQTHTKTHKSPYQHTYQKTHKYNKTHTEQNSTHTEKKLKYHLIKDNTPNNTLNYYFYCSYCFLFFLFCSLFLFSYYTNKNLLSFFIMFNVCEKSPYYSKKISIFYPHYFYYFKNIISFCDYGTPFNHQYTHI